MVRTMLARPVLGISLSLLTLAGCATITTGVNESIGVTTFPAGATCTLRRDNTVIATVSPTPGTATVPKSGHDIAVDCDVHGRARGYAVIPPDFQERTLGNLIIGGLFGYVVDLGSGAASKYPHEVYVYLDRIDGSLDHRYLPSPGRYEPLMPAGPSDLD